MIYLGIRGVLAFLEGIGGALVCAAGYCCTRKIIFALRPPGTNKVGHDNPVYFRGAPVAACSGVVAVFRALAASVRVLVFDSAMPSTPACSNPFVHSLALSHSTLPCTLQLDAHGLDSSRTCSLS